MSSEQKTPPSWYNPEYAPLTGKVGEAAVKGQIVHYPQVVRGNRDYPVLQQAMGLISFMLFAEPKKTKNGVPVYGFFKLRGNHIDVDQCKAKAAGIIREQDSKNKIKIAEVGAWLPITEEEQGGVVQETVDVRTDATEQDKLREIAIKEEKDKAERIMRELREREEEVKNGRDYNSDPEHLDYYTMKKVVWLRLHENIELQRKQLKDLEGKWQATRNILADLDSRHSEYATAWIDNYNIERRKTKIPDYVPSETQNKLYEETGPKQ